MWDGPGPGPRQRGGPAFRGNQRGEMFGGRDHPMPNFRGRDDMNMGSMGLMGPRPLDLPPMDMRRMDGPPPRGRSMEPCDMRGREPNREAMRWGEKPDFSLRKQFENSIREKLINNTGFMGPNRNESDMEGRGKAPWDQHNKFNDIRERDSFHPNMPQFNNPNGEGRRGFPTDRMNTQDGFRDMHELPPMGSGEGDRYNMNFPPHERRRMDFDRRGGPPPFNPRGEFDSDMDFRNRPESSGDFRARDRSPLRFGSNVGSVDHRGSDMSSVAPGPQRLGFTGADDASRDRTCQEPSGSPLMDYRCGEEMTLAEEWKNRQKDKTSFVNAPKGIGEICEPNFPVGFGRDVNVRDPLSFQERGRPSGEFPRNDIRFPRDGHFPVNNSPQIGGNCPQENQPLERGRFTAPFGRSNDGKRWLEERHPKDNQNKSQERSEEPNERFKGLEDSPCATGGKMGHDFQSSSTVQVKDQDYRDIDYRTGSVGTFDYKRDELPPTEKLIPESKPIPPSKFSQSGCQDQDYRSASVEEKVSNTISIIGIPKTATMEQILGAFVVRDGAPLQGMKVKNVVPGYSYDTAYVEFLNLEDAVHFMESNKGSLKVGTRTASMKFVQPEKHERVHELVPKPQDPQLPPSDVPSENFNTNPSDTQPRAPVDPLPHDLWPRNSDLTPEAWQQQVDQQQQQQQQDREQQGESWGGHGHPPQNPLHTGSVFKDSKTMIIKNVKATTTVETILKALDPYAYLDERNVRLVKGKTPGAKCFCFVDMDSHEQVTRLVELLTKPRPLYVDGVRVYAEVAKPLKNQNLRRDFDKPNTSILGCPPEPSMVGLHQFSQPQQYSLPPPAAPVAPAVTPGQLMGGTNLSSDLGVNQGHGYAESQTMDPSFHTGGSQAPTESTSMAATADEPQTYGSGSEVPDMSSYLYDSTSGFYYDPETTLYYDPNSRYFYNAQTQDYLYWDPVSKTYVPVPAGSSAETPSVTMTAEDRAILSNPAADAPLEMRKSSALSPPGTDPAHPSAPEAASVSATTPEKKEDEESLKKDKEDKPKSLAAVKIMKDMERWAKIQNRQKESVRSPSPVLKTGMDDDKKQSKSADAAFAIFERKVSGGDDLFKKPMAPPKKDEKSKRPMGSLGLLVSDYGAGSDEEVEEDREEDVKNSQNSQAFQSKDKEDKLTDWKKMACLLCRRQFPNKDALIRHQQLSDLHKQNMEIHLKIKRSKKELEALENQEREVKKTFKMNVKETRSPEQKRKKHHQHQQHWAEGPREARGVSERPGLGAEPVQKKKKEPVVWDSGAYKQLCRKAMYARFKELE